MDRLARIFTKNISGKSRPIIVGMIHLPPLPSSPRAQKPFDLQKCIQQVLLEVSVYNKFPTIDGLLIENMADVPYLTPQHVRRDGAQQQHLVSFITRLAWEIKSDTSKPCGLQVLAGLNEEALAIAAATGLEWIRVESFVWAHIADEGMLNACAGPLLRYRSSLDMQNQVSIWADVKKKHSSHAITADLDLVTAIKGAVFCGADAVIVTGSETGQAPAESEVAFVREHLGDTTPVIVGSGVNETNCKELCSAGANVLIVGSSFKIEGKWANELDERRIDKFCNEMDKIK